MATTTLPPSEATTLVPVGAGISIPLWYVDAPTVGAFLGPKGEEILLCPGTGHIKLPEPPGLLPSDPLSSVLLLPGLVFPPGTITPSGSGAVSIKLLVF